MTLQFVRTTMAHAEPNRKAVSWQCWSALVFVCICDAQGMRSVSDAAGGTGIHTWLICIRTRLPQVFPSFSASPHDDIASFHAAPRKDSILRVLGAGSILRRMRRELRLASVVKRSGSIRTSRFCRQAVSHAFRCYVLNYYSWEEVDKEMNRGRRWLENLEN